MTILLNLLAIPIGVIMLFIIVILIGLVVEYPVHVFTILFICLIGYALGINLMIGLGWL